jgi:hypothetical protein
VSQKRQLILYFLAQGAATRTLDAEQPPSHGSWVIGRAVHCDINFRDQRISKTHAALKAVIDKAASVEADEPVWRWLLKDVSSTGTYVTSQYNGTTGYRLPFNTPYEIRENDLIQFGGAATKIRFSFDVDPTLNGIEDLPDDDEQERQRGQTWVDLLANWGPAVWAWFKAKHPAEQFTWALLAVGSAALLLWLWER